jgi:hypothetical protein
LRWHIAIGLGHLIGLAVRTARLDDSLLDMPSLVGAQCACDRSLEIERPGVWFLEPPVYHQGVVAIPIEKSSLH